jgi:phage tail-like protein
LASNAPEVYHFNGRFELKVDNIDIGSWKECTGLSVQIEVEEIKEGGQNQFVHKLPGRMKWPNLVFKKGITNSDALFDWFKSSSGDGFAGNGNKLARRTGSVILYGADGKPVRTWKFEGAFPVKWTGPTLAASSRDVAGEELEIAHHGFISS